MRPPPAMVNIVEGTLCVLVVDDAPTDRLRWSLLGRRHGIDVRTADSAREAVGALQHHRPDAVLMDLDMPGTDGVAATRILRADPDLCDLKVVCHSGSPRMDEATATGLFDGALPKDLPDDVLVADLVALVGERPAIVV